MAVFFLDLSAFAKAELAFNESFTLFGARHCVFIGLFNTFLIFGSQNWFFNESVCFLASSSL